MSSASFTVPTAVAVPALRLLPTPAWEPPYDDEAQQDRLEPDTGAADSQGTLALSFVLPSGLPVVPEPPNLRLVSSRAAGDTRNLVAEPAPPRTRRYPRAVDADDDLFEPQPTPRADLPDPQFWAGRLAQAILEVDAGVRPVSQLRRWTSDEVYLQLRRRSNRVRCAAPPPQARRTPTRVLVRSVRVCEPADGIAEVSAVVHDGQRHRAVALRLEGTDGRWRCTVLEQA
jgi:Family of unknown function (DUF6459)